MRTFQVLVDIEADEDDTRLILSDLTEAIEIVLADDTRPWSGEVAVSNFVEQHEVGQVLTEATDEEE